MESLEDHFLNELIENKVLVSIFLVSGVQLKGLISAYDHSGLILEHNNIQLISKPAIASIMPHGHKISMDGTKPELVEK